MRQMVQEYLDTAQRLLDRRDDIRRQQSQMEQDGVAEEELQRLDRRLALLAEESLELRRTAALLERYCEREERQ